LITNVITGKVKRSLESKSVLTTVCSTGQKHSYQEYSVCFGTHTHVVDETPLTIENIVILLVSPHKVNMFVLSGTNCFR